MNKAVLVIVLCIFALQMFPKTWEVGLSKSYTKPGQVAMLVNNGDTVLIDAGLYSGDVAVWTKKHLFIKGNGGFAHLEANGASAQQKAIWVIQGDSCTISNIEFSGCTVPDKNGAGIRMEGTSAFISHCWFHDNENGILAGDNVNSQILIEFCEFGNNGFGDGFSHNLYINHIKSLVFRFNYSHHCKEGHLLKTRAYSNEILFNMFSDEETGYSSMNIDVPNGGFTIIMGNVLMQGVNSSNRSMITYGLEGLTNPVSILWIVNNTFVNKRSTCTFVKIQSGSSANVVNNIFAGGGTEVDGTATQNTNLSVTDIATIYFQNEANYDYHLTQQSPGINGGYDLGFISVYPLVPQYEYAHSNDSVRKKISGTIDIGAYEYDQGNLIPEVYQNTAPSYFNGITAFANFIASHHITRFDVFDLTGSRTELINTDNKILIGRYLSDGKVFTVFIGYTE